MIAELFRELTQAALTGTIAVLLVHALRLPLRRRFGAQAAYGAWLLVPLAIAAVWLPAPTLPTATHAVLATAVAQSQVIGVQTVVGHRFDPAALLMLLWGMGATLTVGLFVARQSRFNRLIERRTDEAFDTVIGHGPAVVGWWRSRIVLPQDFRQRYSLEEQRLVFAHESAHLRRGDIHAQTLATCLRCVFWFNPLIHFAAGRFRFDQELACDATVLAQFPNERRRYGDAMLKTQLAEFGLPVGCHWQSSHPLKERIAMLKQPLPARRRRISGALLTLLLMVAGSYAAWAAQPAVPAKTTLPAAALAAPFVTRLSGDDDLSPPAYPVGAEAAGRSGRVVVAILVGAQGTIKDARVVSADPAGAFEQASLEAARKWKIKPAIRDGKPIESWMKVLVEFKPEDAQGNAMPVTSRPVADIPPTMATAPTLTLSPDGEGLRSQVGSIEVQSAPAVLDGPSRTPPRYPAEALARKQGGLVVLDVLIDTRGAVKQAKVQRSEPAGVFDDAAIEAVRRWKYQPGRKDGELAEYWIRFPVEFDPGA